MQGTHVCSLSWGLSMHTHTVGMYWAECMDIHIDVCAVLWKTVQLLSGWAQMMFELENLILFAIDNFELLKSKSIWRYKASWSGLLRTVRLKSPPMPLRQMHAKTVAMSLLNGRQRCFWHLQAARWKLLKHLFTSFYSIFSILIMS